MNYMRLKDLDTVNEIESNLDISCDSRASQTSYSEIKSSSSPVTNTGFEESTKASNQEKSLERKSDSCCKCGEVPGLLNGTSCACLRLSSLSLIPSHGCEDSVHVTDEQESSGHHVIDDTSKAITEKISFSSQSDHIALPSDSHLLENEKVSSSHLKNRWDVAIPGGLLILLCREDVSFLYNNKTLPVNTLTKTLLYSQVFFRDSRRLEHSSVYFPCVII